MQMSKDLMGSDLLQEMQRHGPLGLKHIPEASSVQGGITKLQIATTGVAVE